MALQGNCWVNNLYIYLICVSRDPPLLVSVSFNIRFGGSVRGNFLSQRFLFLKFYFSNSNDIIAGPSLFIWSSESLAMMQQNTSASPTPWFSKQVRAFFFNIKACYSVQYNPDFPRKERLLLQRRKIVIQVFGFL